MPLSRLDAKAALIVIDLQKGIVAIPTTMSTSDVVVRSAQLARAFRSKGRPVSLVNVTAAAPGRTDAGPRNFNFPEDWTELVPELDQQPSDHPISKKCVGAFIGTDLDAYLRQHGVTQVFLTGIASSGGIESTARSAADFGYNVAIVIDATADRDVEIHNFFVEKLFPRLSETDTTENVLKALAR
jgi:nicotinamidase-related amidase